MLYISYGEWRTSLDKPGYEKKKGEMYIPIIHIINELQMIAQHFFSSLQFLCTFMSVLDIWSVFLYFIKQVVGLIAWQDVVISFLYMAYVTICVDDILVLFI